jgi:hypothetical protein
MQMEGPVLGRPRRMDGAVRYLQIALGRAARVGRVAHGSRATLCSLVGMSGARCLACQDRGAGRLGAPLSGKVFGQRGAATIEQRNTQLRGYLLIARNTYDALRSGLTVEDEQERHRIVG